MSKINPNWRNGMPEFKWTIDNEDYQRARLYRSSGKAWKRYYQGFNTNHHPENPMYKDELQDLEVVYRETLKNVEEDMRSIMPSLMNVLEQFFYIVKQDEALREKLDTLLVKLGKKETETDSTERDDNE
jgi:hypothetical protein